MRRLLCKLIGHRRDAKRARPSFDGWRSSCMLCGERMVRVAPGQWCLVEEVGQPPISSRQAHPCRSVRKRRHTDHQDDFECATNAYHDLFDTVTSADGSVGNGD